MMTDAKRGENLAGLSEVKSSTSELEKCTDVTVSVHKEHMQVVNSCKAQEEIYMDQEAVPATMNKSGLQIEAEKLRRQARCWSGLMVPGVENQCRASRNLLVLVD